ncbi:MAG: hypothetical protein HYV97_11160 [Bdellovibrio sp.]|nr:hypothetical protein [Bdellovibrio sp.]
MFKSISKLVMISFAIISFLGGCGTYRPESIESKMSHYNSPEQKVNQVPVLNINFDVTAHRSPSSLTVKEEKDKNVQYEITELSNFSNKKLYFLALFDQYNHLSRYTPSTTTKIKSCPNFHSGIIEQLGDYPDPNNFKSPLLTQEYQANNLTHVGLQLPMQKDDFHPTVHEFFASTPGQNLYDLQIKALDVHLSKMYDELEELCQYGTSDNYYIFENLTTYIQTQKLNQNNENFKILMRTTLFTNQILSNTFEGLSDKGRQPANGHFSRHYFDGVVKRLNVGWAVSFIDPALQFQAN